jgi:hypothetical protein
LAPLGFLALPTKNLGFAAGDEISGSVLIEIGSGLGTTCFTEEELTTFRLPVIAPLSLFAAEWSGPTRGLISMSSSSDIGSALTTGSGSGSGSSMSMPMPTSMPTSFSSGTTVISDVLGFLPVAALLDFASSVPQRSSSSDSMPYRFLLLKKLPSELGSMPSELGMSGDDFRFRSSAAEVDVAVTEDISASIKSSSWIADGAGRYVDVEVDAAGRA